MCMRTHVHSCRYTLMHIHAHTCAHGTRDQLGRVPPPSPCSHLPPQILNHFPWQGHSKAQECGFHFCGIPTSRKGR